MAAYFFEADCVSAGLARVVNPFAATLINASARPDVLVPTRGTLDGSQPGRCSKIAPRLSDSGEAFPWFENGPDESMPLLSIPYQPGLIARISDVGSLT